MTQNLAAPAAEAPSPGLKFSSVAIVARPDESRVGECLSTVTRALRNRDIEFAVDATAKSFLTDDDVRAFDSDRLFEGRDLVVAIGGDGTLLHAAQAAAVHDVPVVGINLGRLGFLTDLNPHQLPDGLVQILSGKYIVDERPILACSVHRKGDRVATNFAVNDVVVQKWATAGLISFDTYVDSSFVHAQRSDGMIISSSTGSTAYALSGGGPIIHPTVAALALVPICPHSLTNRPIVIPDSATVEVVMTTEQIDEARVTCDGGDVISLAPGDRIEVRRHEKSVRLLHNVDHDHFMTLRTKLNWGTDLC